MKNTEPTLFIVDDNRAMRNALTMLLTLEGFRVESYSGARAFLEAYDFTQPGCLVLDVDMPDMNGLELQEILAAQGSRLPVIFVTGCSDAVVRTRALKTGAVGFIEKPFHYHVLFNRIKTVLEQNRVSQLAEDRVIM